MESLQSQSSYFRFETSVGSIALCWSEEGRLTRVHWNSGLPPHAPDTWVPARIVSCVERMRGYFERGEPLNSSEWDLIDQRDWTRFQRDVYQTIFAIPHGETRTYGWVASRMGKSLATRAVGQALKNNPTPIIVPCHRVVSSVSLGGFMGAKNPSDPEICFKRRLIALEDEYQNPLFPFVARVSGAA